VGYAAVAQEGSLPVGSVVVVFDMATGEREEASDQRPDDLRMSFGLPQLD
jgi:hypothetical protein